MSVNILNHTNNSHVLLNVFSFLPPEGVLVCKKASRAFQSVVDKNSKGLFRPVLEQVAPERVQLSPTDHLKAEEVFGYHYLAGPSPTKEVLLKQSDFHYLQMKAEWEELLAKREVIKDRYYFKTSLFEGKDSIPFSHENLSILKKEIKAYNAIEVILEFEEGKEWVEEEEVLSTPLKDLDGIFEVFLKRHPSVLEVTELFLVFDPESLSPLITDLPDLSPFKNLLSLHVRNQQITVFDGEILPKSLRSATFDNNKISIVTGVDVLEKLEDLDLSNNKISIAFSLPYEITSLDLENNLFRRVDGFKFPEDMFMINFHGNAISNVRGTNFTAGIVDLSDNKIRSLNGLGYSERVRSLCLNDNCITELSEELNGIVQLNLDGNRIRSIQGFHSEDLVSLLLNDNQIADLGGSSLPLLEALEVRNNYLENIEESDFSDTLDEMYVSGNPILRPANLPDWVIFEREDSSTSFGSRERTE